MNEKFNLIERVQKLFLPSEVQCAEYYRKHLANSDPAYLRPFVVKLAENIETEISVIAVGDSVYPNTYFKEKEYALSSDTKLGMKTGYLGISLIIAPEKIMPLKNLRTELSAALRNLGYPFSFEEQLVPEEYGKKEVRINTALCNGTPLELLLGKEEIITATAKHVVEYNKKHGKEFCVLYSD